MPKIIKSCVVCGKAFSVWPSASQRRITCSRECNIRWQVASGIHLGPANTNWKGGDLSAACRHCGKLFTYARGGEGQRARLYCSRACLVAYDSQRLYGVAELPAEVTKTCRICGHPFRAIRGSKERYCSQKCINHSLRTIRGGSRLTECVVCGKQFWAKRTTSARGGRFARYCSQTCRDGARQRAFTCDWCGTPMSKFASHAGYEHHFCSDQHRVYWLNSARSGPSQPERAMKALLESLGLQFVFQHPYGPYLLDFAVLSEKLDIEVDGEYHHGLPGRPEFDARRNRYMEVHAWRVLRFPASQMQNVEAVKERIIASLWQKPLM
jgi:very-short-patch-repair endonuclease